MKKLAILAFLFASCISAQVQLGKNVQIGAGASSGTVTQVDTNATSGISGGPITATGTVACEQSTASQFGCVKPDGTTITASGGVLSATGAGGSGVQYNPTTTAYIVVSTSAAYDDADSNSTNLGVPSSVSCDGLSPTTCTVAFAAAHGLSVAGAIDMFNLSSWPAGPGGLQQAAQYGSFQVTTVPDSTHITFTTPTVLTYSCAPCTGNVYDASYWGIWLFAKEPFIYGHGTVYGIESATNNAVTNWTTLTSGISGSPKFLIDQSGQNDFFNGQTVAQVETSHQSLWALAHTAGMKVLQSTLVNTNFGASPQGTKVPQFNYWVWQQGQTPANTATGKYFDYYVDTAQALLSVQNSNVWMPNPQANVYFADALNTAFGVQKSAISFGPPYQFSYNTSAIGGLGIPSEYNGSSGRKMFFDANWNQWMDWSTNGLSNTFSLYAISNSTLTARYFSAQAAASTWCGDAFGTAGTTNNSFQTCFTYAGLGSTSNYMSFRPYGAASGALRLYVDNSVVVPSVATSPSTLPICPNGTNGALTTSGCSGGASGGTVTYTTSATASTSDAGKLVVMNCSAACSYTLPAAQPSTTWYAGITSQGATLATIVLGGTDTFNGTTAVPLLNSFRILWVYANTATSTDYRGDAPLVAGANMTFTPAANGLTLAATTSGGTGTTVTVNGGAGLTTANLSDTTPTAPANGINVKWLNSGSNVSSAIVGDGNAAHFLNGTGTFSTPAGGSGFTAFPFTTIQQNQGIFGNATSFTITYPQVLQASGATVFVVFATGSPLSATPTGWTRDVDTAQAGGNVYVLHKTSDGTASVALTVTSSASAAYYVVEYSGARSVGASATSTTAYPVGAEVFPAITAPASSVVFAATMFLSGSIANVAPILPDTVGWRALGISNTLTAGGRALGMYETQYAVSAGSITPPNMWLGLASTSAGNPRASFAIQ